MKKWILAAAATAALGASSAWAGGSPLETAPPNNGSGGIFMELTPLGPALNVTSFEVAYTGTVGTDVQVEVWTRPGTYSGFTGSSAGWTLTQTVAGTRGGTTTWTPLALTSDILLPAGETTSVYLHCITAGGGIRYTGTGSGGHQETWANSDLSLFSDVSRTGDASFGGTEFSPRTFSGRVHYTVVPAPGVFALLGLAGVAVRRRRRA